MPNQDPHTGSPQDTKASHVPAAGGTTARQRHRGVAMRCRSDLRQEAALEVLEPGVSALYSPDGSRAIQREQNNVARTYALVIGCNYQRSKGMRLWGACADAREWAMALSARIGVPEKNVTLLVDETANGSLVPELGDSYPSQWNILRCLRNMIDNTRPGGLCIFIFCGRGTMLLDVEDQDLAEDGDPSQEQQFVEEGLLCGDFESPDMVRGYSMRMITTRVAAEMWERLPGGASLIVICDCEHGASILPAALRLDSAHLRDDASWHERPPLKPGVSRTLQEVKLELRKEALAGTPDLDVKRDARDSKHIWPRRRWLRGQMLWGVEREDERDPATLLHPAVRAFSLAVSPGRRAFEATLNGNGGTKGKGGPAGRRGILTHCLLKALEEMNFRGTYYDLWWHAVQVLRSKRIKDQHFQLAFPRNANPTGCAVFEPIAEAVAFANYADMDMGFFADGCSIGQDSCCTSGVEPPYSPWMVPTVPCTEDQDDQDFGCAQEPCTCSVQNALNSELLSGGLPYEHWKYVSRSGQRKQGLQWQNPSGWTCSNSSNQCSTM